METRSRPASQAATVPDASTFDRYAAEVKATEAKAQQLKQGESHIFSLFEISSLISELNMKQKLSVLIWKRDGVIKLLRIFCSLIRIEFNYWESILQDLTSLIKNMFECRTS